MVRARRKPHSPTKSRSPKTKGRAAASALTYQLSHLSGSEPERSFCSPDAKTQRQLKNKWYDSFNSFLVSEILIGELFAHQFFFLGQFDPKAYEHEDESDRSGDVSL